MLSKAWDLVKAKHDSPEGVMPSEMSEMHKRLVRMRSKQDEKVDENKSKRPLNSSTDTRNSYIKGFSHWFSRTGEQRGSKEEFYQHVLAKLSGGDGSNSLLKYEKLWAQHVIRHGSSEMWTSDPMIGSPISLKVLERRIDNIDKKLIDPASSAQCTDATTQDEPFLLERFSQNETRAITQRDDPPEA